MAEPAAGDAVSSGALPAVEGESGTHPRAPSMDAQTVCSEDEHHEAADTLLQIGVLFECCP